MATLTRTTTGPDQDRLVEQKIQVANPNLTVVEARRLERVGKAVEELLDKIE